MTIKECFNTRDFDVEVDEVKRVSAINVGFLTNDGKEDEAQLNVHQNILTEAGINELEELFEYLSKEFNTTKDKVQYCIVVASADSGEELDDVLDEMDRIAHH